MSDADVALLAMLLDPARRHPSGLYTMHQWNRAGYAVSGAHWSGATAIPLIALILLVPRLEGRAAQLRCHHAADQSLGALLSSMAGAAGVWSDRLKLPADRAGQTTPWHRELASLIKRNRTNRGYWPVTPLPFDRDETIPREYLDPQIVCRYNDETMGWIARALLCARLHYRGPLSRILEEAHRFWCEFTVLTLRTCDWMLPIAVGQTGEPVTSRPFERRELRELPTTVHAIERILEWSLLANPRATSPVERFDRFRTLMDRARSACANALQHCPDNTTVRFWLTPWEPAYPRGFPDGTYTVTTLSEQAARSFPGGGTMAYESRRGDPLDAWGIFESIERVDIALRQIDQGRVDEARRDMRTRLDRVFTFANAERWLRGLWPDPPVPARRETPAQPR